MYCLLAQIYSVRLNQLQIRMVFHLTLTALLKMILALVASSSWEHLGRAGNHINTIYLLAATPILGSSSKVTVLVVTIRAGLTVQTSPFPDAIVVPHVMTGLMTTQMRTKIYVGSLCYLQGSRGSRRMIIEIRYFGIRNFGPNMCK